MLKHSRKRSAFSQSKRL